MLVHADTTRAKDHVRSLNVLDDPAMSIKARISVLWGSATLFVPLWRRDRLLQSRRIATNA